MVNEAQFRKAVLPFTLRQEGGLSLDPKDPGNWTGGRPGKGLLKGTRFGIAASAHPTLDIQHLGLEQACDIYWRDYVLAPGFDRLELPLLLVVFDAGVNCGPVRAAAWLAVAEHQVGVSARIAHLSASNLAYHQRLRTWPRYGKVWGTRIEACRRQALLLAAAAPATLAPNAPAPTGHARRAAPRAATQPPAGLLRQLFRVLIDALFSPLPHGVRP